MDESGFSVDVDEVDESVARSVRIRLTGELDLATVGRLEDALVPVLERTPVRQVMVDMAALDFADLAGLRPLLAARSDLARRGGTLSFIRPPYPVRRILELLDTAAPVPSPGG